MMAQAHAIAAITKGASIDGAGVYISGDLSSLLVLLQSSVSEYLNHVYHSDYHATHAA